MDQLLGHEEFIRLSSSILVPLQYIKSCDGHKVVMKTIGWTNEPLLFNISTQRKDQIVEVIATYLQSEHGKTAEESPILKSVESQNKQVYYKPTKDKIAGVFKYIKKHSGCRSTEIVANVGYKLSTTERCLSELRKQGLIEYVGSKKTGGYRVVPSQSPETPQTPPPPRNE
jgi:predicted transcriptional regulator